MTIKSAMTGILSVNQYPPFLLIFCVFSLSACSTGPILVQKYTKFTNSQSKLTYLALGDSYTIGQSVPESMRWPVLLVEKLNENGIGIEQPRIIAKTGWTTRDLIKGIQKEEFEELFRLVSLLIGVNNQFRGQGSGYSIDVFRKEFKELLDTAIAYANHNPEHVFVVSIPDYSVTPFGARFNQSNISRELADYNSIVKEISELNDVKFIDITTISREAEHDPGLLALDKLHPSETMYARWVNEEILQYVLAKF